MDTTPSTTSSLRTGRTPIVFSRVQFTPAGSRQHHSTIVSSTGASYRSVVTSAE